MTIGDRFKNLREAIGLNQSQLARIVRIAPSFISGIERGTKDVSRELMERLLEHYSINLNWLLTGKGNMMMPETKFDTGVEFEKSKSGPDSDLTGATQLRIIHPSEITGSDFLVPLLDQSVSAGAGADLFESDQARALIPAPPYLSRFGKSIAALPVRGDSMEPTLRNGDLVVCDTLGWQDEGIYVVQLNAQSFVKRVTIRLKNFIILSDNRAYPPVEEPLESEGLRIVGKVRCALRSME